MTDGPMLGGHAQPHTVHDFGGFPQELYTLHYPAPGAPDLAESIAQRLVDAGLPVRVREFHGLDHGVWVPLRRMSSDADIPVVPLSVMPHGTAAQHHAVGRALAPLRDEGVLVIGSGGFVHNLGDLDWQHPQAPLAPWAREFGDWMHAHARRARLGSAAGLAATRAACTARASEHGAPDAAVRRARRGRRGIQRAHAAPLARVRLAGAGRVYAFD